MPGLTELLLQQGRATDKQTAHSYGPLYDRWLAPLVDRPVRILALGVALFGGGDLLAFAEFLPLAEIHGVDVNLDPLLPEVRLHPRIVLHPADAYHVATADRLSGPWDVVIDDCCHDGASQKAAFTLYWPLVAPGGRYIIEDIQLPQKAQLEAWIKTQTGARDAVEVYDLTHERPNDNIIARIVRSETDSPNS